jgi:hypothetical protein
MQLLHSYEVNIENCQPEGGCIPRGLQPEEKQPLKGYKNYEVFWFQFSFKFSLHVHTNNDPYNVEGENRLLPGLQPRIENPLFFFIPVPKLYFLF